MEILGIDIGGTGIKGAPVDTLTGGLLGERFRLLTPSPATPAAVSATVAESGVKTPDDVRRYRAQGASMLLVGEALSSARDPAAATRALVTA